MSLLRQLIFAISLLFIGLLTANLMVSVYNARVYLAQQMQVQADDTATSLGLTISQAAQAKDLAQLNSMVDVIFDRGYYRRIIYRSLAGDSVVERQLPINIEGVPAWFIGLISLPEPSGRAEVVSGWYRLGELEVVAHPGYAYRDLWRVFNEQLWLFVITALLCCGLASLGLRYLLTPLKKVERQAEAICRREFPVQDDLPRTPELRRMVVAMNRMVTKIKAMFQEQVELSESLHYQSFRDSITGLSNRRDFDARFEAYIRSERGGGAGALLLLQVSQLQSLNEDQGRDTGDQCLRSVAESLEGALASYEGAIVSRRSGADFCVFVPGLTQDDAEQLAAHVFDTVKSNGWFAADHGLDIHLGLAYSQEVTLDNQLLAQADLSLRQAQHRDSEGWNAYIPEEESIAEIHGAGDWQALLQQALEERRVELHYQPVVAADDQSLLHVEVLCRLRVGESVITAGVFWPMVERFRLSASMDQLVIEQLLDDICGKSGDLQFCINLSPNSVREPGFVDWLLTSLDHRREVVNRLTFELPEASLESAEVEIRSFAEQLFARGAGLSLDHFGLRAQALHRMQSLPLASLKVDSSFVRHIDRNADNRFFVKSLVQIAHSCDIKILAEGVETQEEWKQLQSLGLDGAQGYHLGRPAAEWPFATDSE